MINIEFTPAQVNLLLFYKKNHEHPRVRQKMEALYYKSLGVPHHLICDLCDIGSRATLVRYIREYKEGGLERLMIVKFHAQESVLVQHIDKIAANFNRNPPATINEARHRIGELTGIHLSNTAVGRFLQKHLGFRRYKTGSIPDQQNDPERQKEQEDFKQNKLEPRLEEMREGRREVFFADASHFVWAAFLGYLWCVSRFFVSSPSGRKRFNVLSALCARTHRLITVTNDTYINADSVCELLMAIASIGFQVPVTVVLDNARYQHAKLVKEQAEKLGIELLFLPAYSPNLNLIERLWKFVKKECLYSRYYENYDQFKEAIQNCLAKVGTQEYEPKLKTLLTLNFQTFKPVKILPSCPRT